MRLQDEWRYDKLVSLLHFWSNWEALLFKTFEISYLLAHKIFSARKIEVYSKITLIIKADYFTTLSFKILYKTCVIESEHVFIVSFF